MSKTIIFDPEIRINNETFATVPNTIRLTNGKGESLVKPQSSGNGEVEMVYSEDVETKIAKLMVSVFITAENMDKILELKNNRFNNYIALNATNFNVVINEAALINDPEQTLGNDGQAELEFHGKPVE